MVELSGKKYYTVNETAEILNVSAQTIRRWIREGQLKAARLGRAYMVSEKSISEMIKE
jgi:excisionase family DNA binding protein